jgi:hypothetical protein
MSTFGEDPITVNGRLVGKLRLLGLYTPKALFPRIVFRVGVSLQDSVKDEFSPGRSIEKFEMRALSGEWRLSEHDQTIGRLYWIGHHRHVRSASYPSEANVEVACDLDEALVEQIEERRDGGEPNFWVAFWPSLVDASGYLDTDSRPFRIQIPRDQWLAALAGLTQRQIAVLEVGFPAAERDFFQAAIGHARQARQRLLQGDYDEAVASCRRALEAVTGALGAEPTAEAVATLLSSRSDIKRAEVYAGMFKRIKDLGNYTIHRAEAPGKYSRAEARFTIGVTEQLIALIGALTAPIQTDAT